MTASRKKKPRAPAGVGPAAPPPSPDAERSAVLRRLSLICNRLGAPALLALCELAEGLAAKEAMRVMTTAEVLREVTGGGRR